MIGADINAWANFSAGDASEERFRNMMEALPVATYATDTQGRLTYFNSAAANLFGQILELGTDRWHRRWKIFLPDGTSVAAGENPMAVSLNEQAAGGEYIAERPDGTRFWFTSYPALLRDAEGRITGSINMLVDITEHKAALGDSEERFRALAEATPECVKLVAPDGTVLYMNSSGLKMVGATAPEAVIGKKVYDLIAPEDRNSFQEFNERICRGEEGCLEFDILGSDGTRRHMETHAAPLKYLNGTTVQLGITRDITERNRIERAALLLSAVVDSSDDAIISKDLNGTITSWNKSAHRLFGYAASEAIGQPITMIIPIDRMDEEPKILQRLKRGERVDHFETLRRRKDGTLIDISLTISPVKDGRGNIIGASKIARDITDSKRAEAALRASEMRFRQLADSMPQMVWTAHPDGYIDYYNEQWYAFTGLDRDIFGHMNWDAVLHPGDLKLCRDTWHSCVKSGEPYRMECRIRNVKDDRWRWFIVRARPVRDGGGKLVKWFGTCTDIDDQKRVEEELRRANQDLEQFAFSASHDLQEPLRTVLIYSELLSKRCRDKLDGAALQFLSHVRQGAWRMEMLVRDLLAYTKVSQLETQVETTDANEAFSNALANLTEAAAEANARITCAPLPTVSIQNTHLQQLFQNLIGNAIKYRSPDRPPAVHVSAQRHKEEWVFSVTDNGIGIDPEYKERIFGLFKRLHTNDTYSGTGVGLAICQRIVERYNGRIWVESTPGQGSTFRFTLPV